MNKATRVNRGMLIGTLFMAVLLFGLVFAFLYASFNVGSEEPADAANIGDSILLIIEGQQEADSMLLSD